jgi:cholesterol transport system auxiliary component
VRRGLERRAVGAAAIALALAVAGCGGGQTLEVFDLTAPDKVRGPRGGVQIVVAEPLALQIYDSDRIVVRSGTSVSLLPGAQWSDRLPKLLQARLVQTFENQSRAARVGRPGDRIVADRQLVAEIRAFDIRAEESEAVVSITVKMVDDKAGRIAAARLFTAREPVAAIDPKSATAALDRALSKVLVEIIGWAR